MNLPVVAREGGVSHLYLHVPFCRNHCSYCDYAVTTERPPAEGVWRDALAEELRLRGGVGLLSSPLATVLVGGGTPSTLGPRLAGAVRALVGSERIDGAEEWTIEANPEDVTCELLEGWRRAGVTRPGLGVQSLQGSVLAWLGRAHGPGEGRDALRRVSQSGFPTWSVDLLYGLPGHLDSRPLDSLREVVAAGAPHISVYELVAEPGTRVNVRSPTAVSPAPGPGSGPGPGPAGDQAREPEADDRAATEYLEISAFLHSEGYEAWEMMSFARPGHASRHGLGVLRGESFVGLGPGAHSRHLGRARWNLRDWQRYWMSLKAGRIPEEGAERIGAAAGRLESIWAGLRLSEGVSADGLTPAAREIVAHWSRIGLAREDATRVALTPEGWLRLDELVVALDGVMTPEEPEDG